MSVDKLIDELLDRLDPETGPQAERYERLVRKYMEQAYQLGKERGKGEEGNYWLP